MELKKYKDSVNGEPGSVKNLLLVALAQEVATAYFYWLVPNFLAGNERKSIGDTFLKYADDEFNDHATKIKERLEQLYTEPFPVDTLTKVDALKGFTQTPLQTQFSTLTALHHAIEAEEVSIAHYEKCLQMEEFKNDPVTFAMVRHILGDEYEHLTELKNFLEDINSTQD